MSVGTSAFARALADRQPDPAGRRWLFVPDDQLSDAMGPLAGEDTHGFGIGLGERTGKAAMAAADREPGRRGSVPKARGRAGG